MNYYCRESGETPHLVVSLSNVPVLDSLEKEGVSLRQTPRLSA